MKTSFWKSISEIENRNGVLYFEGCHVRDLVKAFGSPLYAYSKNRILANCRRIIESYKKHYPKFQLYYAIKANNNPSIVRLLGQEGLGADASCVPEIRIALDTGIKPEKILYSAVYPSENDLRFALNAKVKINLEDISQLDVLKKIGVPEFICLRVNPGFGNSGIKGLVFTGPDAKFGIPEDQIEEAFKKAKHMGVKRFGIHMMTGSNILNPDYFEVIVERIMDIAGPISQKLGIQFELIDLGGSLGVPYKPEEHEIDMDIVAKKVATKLKQKLVQYNMTEPTIIHEPGRYIVCDAGILISQVVAIKRSQKTFIGLDAGMHTLLRPALYDAFHQIWMGENLHAPCDAKVNLVGQICESTDTFAKDRLMPSSLDVNDLLVFANTGAYGYCMSSHYNSQPKAAEILVDNGKIQLIRKRESYEDLIRNAHIN